MLHSKWSLRLTEVHKFLCIVILVTVFFYPVAIDANCTISGKTKFAPQFIQNAGYNICVEPPLARPCSTTKRYYSWDGSCVNLKHPHWGQTRTSYTRLLKPDYVPGTSLPRKSVNGGNLPLARVISTTIFTDQNIQSNRYTVLFYGFGQFIDHDITLSAPKVDNNVTCCNGFNNTVKNPDPSNCMATIIPPNDPDYGKFGVTCIEARRTITTAQQGCALNPPRPVNQAAAPLDLSILYGDNQATFNILRAGVGGKLAVSSNVTEGNGLNFPPVKSNCPFGGIDPTPGGRCFATGEFRVQQNPEIMINTITFLRMHNFIAEGLAGECPHCTDEALFQESRKLLCALYQNIVYSEYIPPLVGKTLYGSRGLNPQAFVKYAPGPDLSVNVQAITEYAAAVGRVSHSMIKSLVNYQTSSGAQSYSLPSKFFNQAFFLDGDTCSGLASGYAATSAMEEDQFVSKAVSFKLFLSVTRLFGQDLISVDINRARDQGVATYVQVRKACGLCPVNSFDDLAPLIRNPTTNIPKLKTLYNNTIADADLYVIGALEIPVDTFAIVGPTLSCVFAEQFHRSMYGDRLFYSFKSAGYSPAQVNYIRSFTYAQLLCYTQNIDSIQPFALLLSSSSNPVLPCSQLAPGFNFTLFQIPPNFVSQPSTLSPVSTPATSGKPLAATSTSPPPPSSSPRPSTPSTSPPPSTRPTPNFNNFDPQDPLAAFGVPSF